MSQTSQCSVSWTEVESSSREMGTLSELPNELIGHITDQLSPKDLSVLTLTNKAMRDFICDYYFESRKGLKALLGTQFDVKKAFANDQQELRIETFGELGLLLKRMTCVLPTYTRLEILFRMFDRLEGIPRPSLMPTPCHLMRFTFRCYGKLIRRLIAGWDYSELITVFKVVQSNQLFLSITQLGGNRGDLSIPPPVEN